MCRQLYLFASQAFLIFMAISQFVAPTTSMSHPVTRIVTDQAGGGAFTLCAAAVMRR